MASCFSASLLIATTTVLFDSFVVGFSHTPWVPASLPVAPTTTIPATNSRNPRYPDLPFDNYLANPFFQKINTDYPGLQLIHEDPFVFVVNNFLTDDECDRFIQKAMTGTASAGRNSLRPQVGGGAVVRTSNGVVCENEEVPTVRQKSPI